VITNKSNLVRDRKGNIHPRVFINFYARSCFDFAMVNKQKFFKTFFILFRKLLNSQSFVFENPTIIQNVKSYPKYYGNFSITHLSSWKRATI